MENELVASNTTTNTKMKKTQKNTTTTTERHGHAMHQESQCEMLKNSEKLKKYIEKVHSRGIVYLSRLPPNMVCCQTVRVKNVLLSACCP